MNIAVICTGTELLKGYTVNSNLAVLGAHLVAAGMPLSLEICVGDRPAEIGGAIAMALKNADTIVLCGGLGPTLDDITLDVAAKFFGCELQVIPELAQKVTDFWHKIHSGHCPKNQLRQARVPVGGHFLPNPVGSASGIAFSSLYGGKMRHIFLLPGPPTEFIPMMRDYLIPELVALDSKRRHTIGFLAAGIGESTLAKAVEPVLKEFPVEIAYTAVPGGTKLFLEGDDPALLETAIQKARTAAGPDALPAGVTDLFEYLISLLQHHGLSLVTAESCTGGLIARTITDFPGVSSVFKGSVVSYANQLKEELLQVPHELLESLGAVSTPVAAAMAENAAKLMQADCAISTTGIAGPDGGSPDKPVGLVFIACRFNGKTVVEQLNLRGGREAIRQRAAAKAVYLLIRMIREKYA